jgi:hypothetical protein
VLNLYFELNRIINKMLIINRIATKSGESIALGLL